MSSIGSGGGSNSQEFELNLASIIDCFTVLITFMLATASFLSIGVLDAGVAAAGAASSSTAPPPIQISVELSQNQQIEVKVSGKAQRSTRIPALADQADLATLGKTLAELKTQWPDVNAATLTAETTVEYERVIKTMDSMRKSLPVVLLGGF
jgi:biopolymer transport protein ExbD